MVQQRPGATDEETDDGTRPAPARRLFRLFWPWLGVTTLLAALVAGLAWHLATREPTIVEVAGPTPPPLEPPTEVVYRAEQLGRLVEAREAQLTEAIERLDPPACAPPKVPDANLLEQVRAQEAPNIARWRALLAPAPQASQPVSPPATVLPQKPDAAPSAAPQPQEGALAPKRRVAAVAPMTASDYLAAMSVSEMRAHLENSSAIVLGFPNAGQGQLLHGSGFFISPTDLVTNLHVIAEADPAELFVTSTRLGRAMRVRIVATSGSTSPGEPDFAVLRLVDGHAPAAVSLATQIDKLSPVLAAGYSGLGLATDGGFQDFIRGARGAAPDLNMNRGDVRSIRAFGAITQIVHTADVLKGYSGGPLMDACGRIVGVNTFIQVDQAQAGKLNNAIGASDLLEFLSRNGIEPGIDLRRCPTN